MNTHRAFVTHPPSLNGLYGLATKKIGQRTIPYPYMTPIGKAFIEGTVERLRYDYRWPSYAGQGLHVACVEVTIASKRCDLDNLHKALQDAIKRALDIDDEWFIALPAVKIFTDRKEDQGTNLLVDVLPMASKRAAEELATKLSQQHLFHAWLAAHS